MGLRPPVPRGVCDSVGSTIPQRHKAGVGDEVTDKYEQSRNWQEHVLRPEAVNNDNTYVNWTNT